MKGSIERRKAELERECEVDSGLFEEVSERRAWRIMRFATGWAGNTT